jgi:hypothetical protein
MGKIYFDRDIGYYCMLCGHKFSAVDVEILIENKAISSSPARKSKRKLPLEIKDIPSREVKEHISSDSSSTKSSSSELPIPNKSL